MFNKICNLTHSENTFTWALTFAPQDRKGHVALQQAGDFSVLVVPKRWDTSRAAGTSLVVRKQCHDYVFFSELYLQNPFEACESEQSSRNVWSANGWDELLNSCLILRPNTGQLERE